MAKKSGTHGKSSKGMRIRIIIVMLLFGFAVFIPIARALVNLQLIDEKDYSAKAVDQQTRDTIITPKRGVIYDTNGKELALSASAETVYISPADIKDAEMEALVAKTLSDMFELDYDKTLEKTKNKDSYYQVIKKKIDLDKANMLREKIKESKIKGIHLIEDTKRYYPYGNFASQILGFCGDENTGLYGLEMFYEDALKGMPGRVIASKNAAGTDMPFKYEERLDAQNGQNLVLTIDETIQQVLESRLETAVIDSKAASRGAGIVYDVTTGEVLAMATMSSFDLNSPSAIADTAKLEEIKKLPDEEQQAARSAERNAQWRNKFISDSYEPGSVFKTLTIAMGLEEGVVSPNTTFNCPGFMQVADRRIKCWKKGGHGTINLAQALEKSCNVALMQIGARIGNEKFYDYVTAFGLRERTGIDLPGEAKGLFFGEKLFKDTSNRVSLAVASFGQTFKVTPMQMVCAIGAVVNDGKLMKPHIVKEIVDDNNIVIKSIEPEMVRQVVSHDTSLFLRDALEQVVTTGTGKNAYVEGYRIGGKTGTSEKVDEYVEGEKEKYIASFIGVAPMDAPKIAILVMIDTPTGEYYEGSQIAAPVVGKVFSEILPYLGIAPETSTDSRLAPEVLMPRLIGASRDEVKSALKDSRYKGFSCKTVGDGDTVTDQIPANGVYIQNNSQIVLYYGGNVGEAKVEMPEVIGMSPENANRVLTNAGLYMKATGAIKDKSSNITASKQSFAAGAQIPLGSVVSVEFYDVVNVKEGASGRY